MATAGNNPTGCRQIFPFSATGATIARQPRGSNALGRLCSCLCLRLRRGPVPYPFDELGASFSQDAWQAPPTQLLERRPQRYAHLCAADAWQVIDGEDHLVHVRVGGLDVEGGTRIVALAVLEGNVSQAV